MMESQPTCHGCGEPRTCANPYCIDCQTPTHPEVDRR